MDLSTRYLGLDLRHPVVASASPLSSSLDGIRRLEDGGAAAVVMFSLFEEQLQQEMASVEHLTAVGSESFAESLSYFSAVEEYHVGPDRYLDLVARAAEAVDIPVIASLNCVTASGWNDYAQLLSDTGASGIELNVYYLPADPELTGQGVEQLYLEALKAAKAASSVPVGLKISPYFSAMAHMAQRFEEAGADGLALFNRFYQPDFDLDELSVAPDLQLSEANEIRLPLRWIAMLHGRVSVPLAATTGVQGPQEVIKYLLAGADAVMTTSALLRHGPAHCQALVDGLSDWMERRGYESVGLMKGALSQKNVADPTAFARANYVRMLEGWKNPYTLSGA